MPSRKRTNDIHSRGDAGSQIDDLTSARDAHAIEIGALWDRIRLLEFAAEKDREGVGEMRQRVPAIDKRSDLSAGEIHVLWSRVGNLQAELTKRDLAAAATAKKRQDFWENVGGFSFIAALLSMVVVGIGTVIYWVGCWLF